MPAGVARLDGVAGALEALAGDGRASLSFAAPPTTHYARVDAVLATVKRAGVTRTGFAALPDAW